MIGQITIEIDAKTIATDAADICAHFRKEDGSIFFQSDVEDAIADMLSEAFELLAQELPNLIKDGSWSPKKLDLSNIIRTAKAKLVEVDNDHLYRVEPIAA